MNRRKVERPGLTAIAKALIIITAIGHLIFTNIHVRALLLLENEICGFIMFLFVLFGLVTMFEATRIKDNGVLEQAIAAVFCLITSGFGAYLVHIYHSAIVGQRSLEGIQVHKAVVFSSIIIGAYVISAVLLALGCIRREQKR